MLRRGSGRVRKYRPGPLVTNNPTDPLALFPERAFDLHSLYKKCKHQGNRAAQIRIPEKIRP